MNRRGMLCVLLTAPIAPFIAAMDRAKSFVKEWREAAPTRFAWGQGLDDFEGCRELPTPCRAIIDWQEADEWIDFVDLNSLEYRVIFRNSRGETILTKDGLDVIRYKVVAHSSMTIIDADGIEWSSNYA